MVFYLFVLELNSYLGIRQGTREMMRVEIPVSCEMFEANLLATLDGLASLTNFRLFRPLNGPVAIDILLRQKLNTLVVLYLFVNSWLLLEIRTHSISKRRRNG